MTYQEIKSFINTYIVHNGVGAITGSRINTALNALADYYGFDSVVVTTLPAGSEATANVQGRTLELGIPRGANGNDGLDATNPFKGWFNSLADLKASYTASVGDSAYVKDASPATTWSTYIYDETASSDNFWADSGIDADTSNVQTFSTGEEVNQVAIDKSKLVNPVNTTDATKPVLARAEDVMNFASKLEALTMKEQKQTFVGVNGYYRASTKTIIQYSTSRYTEIPITSGFNRIRFRGMSFKGANASYMGYAFKSQNNYILSKAFLDNVTEQIESVEPKEYIVDIPEGATSFIVSIQFAGSQTVTEDSFYCYFQKGISSVDYSQRLFKAKYERLVQGYINVYTGNINTNNLDNYVALYPVLGGQKLLLLYSNVAHNANYYAFYSSIDSSGKYRAIDNVHYYFDGVNTINVPQNANYIGILYRFSGVGSLEDFSIYSEPREYEFIDKNVVFAPIETHKTYSFLRRDGSFYSGDGFGNYKSSYTDIIPCSEGDEFGYFGYGSGTEDSLEPIIVPTSSNFGVSWIFYDSENNVVSAWRMSRYGYYNVVIPSGVVGVRFASIIKTNTINPAYFFKVSVLNSVLKSIDVIERNPESKNWSGLKWIAFGDSLTEHNYRATKNYHDYIAEWTGIGVVNRGLSGSGYKELDSSNNAFYQRVQRQVESDADIITFFGSGNDLHRNSQGTALKYPIGEVTDANTTTICGCINQTFDYMQANYPLMPLGVITPTPWRQYNQIPSNVSNNTMTEYCEKLIEICRRRGIPYLDLYHCSNLHPESNSFCGVAYKRDATYTITTQGTQGAIEVTEDLLPIVQEFGAPEAVVGDWVLPNYTGVHPDEDGHKLIAPRIKIFIKSLIEK